MRLLVFWSFVALVLLSTLGAIDGLPQHTPPAQKISILDLFKEDPSLKTQLEASLTKKKSVDAPAPARRDSRVQETASKPVTKPETTTTTTTTPATTTTQPSTTTSAPTQNARSILRPRRPTARRRGRVSAEPKAAEPEVAQPEAAEEPSVVEETAPVVEEEEQTTTAKPLNRFSRLRANRRPLLPAFKGTSAGSGNVKKTESTAEAAPRTEGRPSFGGPRIGGNRSRVRAESAKTTTTPASPRNARINSRSRSSGANAETKEEEPKETGFRPAGRLTIGSEGRRFSNARNPRTRGRTTTEEPPIPVEEEITETTGRSRFRNARVFPGSRKRLTTA